MEKTFRFNSIAEFHTFCNLPAAEHPLISLIDYSKVSYPMAMDSGVLFDRIEAKCQCSIQLWATSL